MTLISWISLKLTVNGDKVSFITAIAELAKDAANEHDSRAFHLYIKALTPKRNSKPAMVVKEDGSYAATNVEIRERWQRHFASKLCGKQVTFQSLLDGAIRRQANEISTSRKLPLSHTVVPLLGDVAQAMCKGKAGRGHGEDCLPAELYIFFARECARLMHPA